VDDVTRWWVVGALASLALVSGLLGAWLDAQGPREPKHCPHCRRTHKAYEACGHRGRR
jgi:hypothetical protein